jgi:transcriptional regulator with XRE-family HTH domain
VRRAKVNNGLTQRDIGLRAQCHNTFVSQLLTGRKIGCTRELAERLAAALDTPYEDLFFVRRVPTHRTDG